MLKLTHKAIARMAGYRVNVRYGSYPNIGLDWGDWWSWEDPEKDTSGIGYERERDAWKACCIENGLIEEE